MMRVPQICICIALVAGNVIAQTVTGSGTTNTVPAFNGTSSITNSVITQSGGNVVLGSTSTFSSLNVNGQIQSIYPGAVGPSLQLTNPSKTTNGTANYWNIYNMSGGYGNSLQFWDYDTIGCATGGMCSPRLTLMDNGNVGIGTTNPAHIFQIEQDLNNPVVSSIVNASSGTNSFSRISVGMTPSSGVTYGDFTYFNTGYTSNGIYVANRAVLENNDSGGLFLAAYNSSGVLGFATGGSGTERMRIDSSGNVGIGTTSPAAKLEINGNFKLTSGSGGSITYADGTTQTTAWTGVLCGGDYAESVDVNGDRTNYKPGDVLVIDPKHPGKFLKSAEPYSTTVTGIYATKPGVVGRRQVGPKQPDEVPMAMIGIVPTRVSAENGPIHAGDLLVTSSTLGYAMKGTDRTRMPGAILGKALGNLDSGRGVIEVVVTLQ